MNLTEYQKRALETAMYPKALAVPYCALGLCGEIAELTELLNSHAIVPQAKELSELSDCCWYVATLAFENGIELLDSMVLDFGEDADAGFCYRVPDLEIMAMHAGLLANKAKKVIRDGTAMAREFVETHLVAILRAITRYANYKLGIPLSDVLEYNIAKLASRKERGVITGSGDNR